MGQLFHSFDGLRKSRLMLMKNIQDKKFMRDSKHFCIATIGMFPFSSTLSWKGYGDGF